MTLQVGWFPLGPGPRPRHGVGGAAEGQHARTAAGVWVPGSVRYGSGTCAAGPCEQGSEPTEKGAGEAEHRQQLPDPLGLLLPSCRSRGPCSPPPPGESSLRGRSQALPPPPSSAPCTVTGVFSGEEPTGERHVDREDLEGHADVSRTRGLERLKLWLEGRCEASQEVRGGKAKKMDLRVEGKPVLTHTHARTREGMKAASHLGPMRRTGFQGRI